MTEIFKIIAISLISIVIAILIKPNRPEIAIIISILASIIILSFSINALRAIIYTFKTISDKSNINLVHIKIILKIIGVTYITQFAAGIANDVHETGIAHNIEFAGKIFIFALSVPIITSLLELILKILEPV